MTIHACNSIRAAVALLFVLFAGNYAPMAGGATPADDPQPAATGQDAKPMMKREPMAGEMKKDGMMKEDVSKAAKAWSEKMDEKLKQEKMK